MTLPTLVAPGPLFRKASGFGVYRGPYFPHMAALFPVAHATHWLWVLYVPPVLVVLASILRTTLRERREKRED